MHLAKVIHCYCHLFVVGHNAKAEHSTILPRSCQMNRSKLLSALAGVAQWIEHRPANQRVVSSIPSQGTWMDFGPGPQWVACERQPHIDVSLPLSLPSPLFKNK